AADDPESQARIGAFLQGLQQSGWTIGSNVRIDYRWGATDYARYHQYGEERSFRLIRPAQQKRVLQRRYQSRGPAAHTISKLPQPPTLFLPPPTPVLRAETESVIPAMCNRIRGLKEWSDIPRSLTRALINFEYNPNVAPTEQVPAFLAERSKPLATRMARFGINLA